MHRVVFFIKETEMASHAKSVIIGIRRLLFSTLGPTSPSTVGVHDNIKELLSKGLYQQTLELYRELHHSGFNGISSILPSAIKASSSSAQFHDSGLQLHCVALKTGFDTEAVVSNSVISMYAKFLDPNSARKVFDSMPHRDPITWNAMVNCLLQNGYFVDASEILKEMYLLGFVPKPELLASMLSICGKRMDLRLGRQVHALAIVDQRIEKDSVFLSSALVDFYFRCNESLMALHVFNGMEVKNEVSWTAMISGCINNQDYEMGFACFQAMEVEGVKPNKVTSMALLLACAELRLVKHGKEIHGHAFRHGFESSHSFSSALINMYCKRSETFCSAKLIFERSIHKDVVLWTSMIGSYSQRGDSYNALTHFSQMRMEEIEPNSVTLLAIISASTYSSSLRHGCGIHGYILKCSFTFDICVGNALINMYAKCGCLQDCCKLFLEMPAKDSISWSAMISACGLHGCGEQALQFFHEMEEKGVKPDAITFLAVLSACNHAGLVDEGQKLFQQLSEDYKLPLTLEHYACQADLLGKSGKLEEALNLVRNMPIKPSARIWSSLVSASKLHGRLDIAETLAQQLVALEPDNPANYSLLSMIHAEHGNWLNVEKVRGIMKQQGLKKCYGFSRIEVGNEGL